MIHAVRLNRNSNYNDKNIQNLYSLTATSGKYFGLSHHYGLHHSYHRQRKLKQARKLLGLEPDVLKVEMLDLKTWLKEILGEGAVNLQLFAKSVVYKVGTSLYR